MFELKVYLCIWSRYSNISSFISLRLPDVHAESRLHARLRCTGILNKEISLLVVLHVQLQIVTTSLSMLSLYIFTYPFEVCFAKCCVNVKSWNHCCRRIMRFEKRLYEYYYVSQYFLLLSRKYSISNYYDLFYLQLKIFGVRSTQAYMYRMFREESSIHSKAKGTERVTFRSKISQFSVCECFWIFK